ncbi:DUF1652 domain-containing protein [Pseudomonas sp. GD03842]|uniref:DUF1652 domain-containing protein n=1 Tax=unclassified Pseudomonas TaxID=196821 RepID=UPI000D3CE26E|nr:MULTISPECIES: DUF1652 domain-containing protein [unclassified Pseudomonas]MDH0748874.1 DUF1652 domain-containing protein [Pseudomonas sp. GD03842]RAU44102.1 DUF1652 domain-containing protein [Pseudomonas sp. RIT 409]RAU54847.1 DUF1652 domain-containing protein [Pseudomonas sp. RIT 412]
MAISLLELRHIIESGFLPLECRCTASASNELTIELVDPATGANLVTGGINAASLDNSRAIAELVAQLRTRFAQTHGRESRRTGRRA